MTSGNKANSGERVTHGSSNIFADLGLPNADEHFAKVRIAHQIRLIIDRENLNQNEAAKRLGVDQPKVSALLRGRLAGFSMERLFHFLNKLGRDVTIRIVPAQVKEASIHVLFDGNMNGLTPNCDEVHVFERFTDRARKVMALANQEAQHFNHEYIGAEHILLGLVKEGTGVGARVLKNLNVDLGKVRLEVEKLFKSGPYPVAPGKLPLAPSVKTVIECAIEESRNLNHNYVGTEHLLLGLLREYDGVAAQVLMYFGLKLDEVREEVLNMLAVEAVSKIQKKNLSQPDEKRTFDKGQLEIVSLGGITFARATFQPGWRWSTCVKPLVKTKSCEKTHVGYQVPGRLHVVLDDGSEVEIGPAEVYSVGPGHDAWVVGDEPVVAIDISGMMTDYAKRK